MNYQTLNERLHNVAYSVLKDRLRDIPVKTGVGCSVTGNYGTGTITLHISVHVDYVGRFYDNVQFNVYELESARFDVVDEELHRRATTVCAWLRAQLPPDPNVHPFID